MRTYPRFLSDESDFLRQLSCFFILTEEQHIDHTGNDRQRADETDHVEAAREEAADLVDAQRHRVGEAALIGNGAHRRLNTRNEKPVTPVNA